MGVSRFSFPFPRTLGDELLAGATVAKLWLHRPADGQPQCEFELQGSLNGDVAADAARLVEHFLTPREEGGAA